MSVLVLEPGADVTTCPECGALMTRGMLGRKTKRWHRHHRNPETPCPVLGTVSDTPPIEASLPRLRMPPADVLEAQEPELPRQAQRDTFATFDRPQVAQAVRRSILDWRAKAAGEDQP